MIPGDRIVKYRHRGRMRHRIGSGRRGQTSMKLKSTKGKEKTIHRKRGLTKADRVSYLGRPESVFSPRGEGSKNIERRSRKFSLSRGGQLGRRRPSDLNLTRGETGFFPCERPVSSVDRSCSCCALISSSVRPWRMQKAGSFYARPIYYPYPSDFWKRTEDKTGRPPSK